MVYLESFGIKINHDPLFCPIIYGPPLYTHFFALLFLALGQFNRGKDNTKLLIGTSKTGDHGCLIEVTAKYRSFLTIIKGSYFQDFNW